MSKMSGWDKIRHLPADDPRRINSRLKSIARLKRRGGRKRTPEEQRIHSRKNMLRRHYDLTVEEYDDLFVDQNGVCAICLRPELGRRSKGTLPKRLSVDHCHVTDRVRGLLCHECNVGLGFFHDDPLRLQEAISYLAKQ